MESADKPVPESAGTNKAAPIEIRVPAVESRPPERTSIVESAARHAAMLSSVVLREAAGSPVVTPSVAEKAKPRDTDRRPDRAEQPRSEKVKQAPSYQTEAATDAAEETLVAPRPIKGESALLTEMPDEESQETLSGDFEPSSEFAANDDTEAVSQLATFERFVNVLLAVGDGEEDELRIDNPWVPGLPPEAQLDAPVTEVAERLASLASDEKLMAAPITQEITITLQAIEALRAESAPDSQILAAEEKLTELTTQLFEILGFKYNEAKVEQFVRHLLEPKLIEYLANDQPIAIEGIGTHEIKRYLRELVSTLSSLFPQPTIHQLLGTLAINTYR